MISRPFCAFDTPKIDDTAMSLLAYSITRHFPGFLCPRQLTLLCYTSLFVNSMLSAQNPPPFTMFTPALQHTVLNGGIVLHFKAACWPFNLPPTQMQIHSLLTTTTNLNRHCFYSCEGVVARCLCTAERIFAGVLQLALSSSSRQTKS